MCVLSVSGALGVTPSGGGTGQHDAVTETSSGPSDGRVQTTGRGPTGDSGTPRQADKPAAPGRTASTPPEPPTAHSAALPAGSGTGRRVVFDIEAQRVWLVGADGKIERTYLVSGSKFDNLDAGTYQVYSRDLHATAYNSDETMTYMVRFATGRNAPIGFHSIPVLPNGKLVESRSQLGTPQSDGCIRQWLSDARALWTFAPVGTKVVVLA